MTRSRQTADWGSRAGLAKIVPSSVAVGSGTGSADSLGTVTFSGASSVSLNGCFSSAYENYRIFVFCKYSGTSGNTLRIRMRSAGTDNTNNWNSIVDWSSNNTLGTGSNDSGLAYGEIGYIGNLVSIVDGVIVSPFLADNTGIITNAMEQSNSDQYTLTFGSYHSQQISYDGCTIYPPSGTITGNIRIYGIN